MASEIRVNKINSRTGVGTITLSPTGVDFTGIATVATLKATTGIVTTLSATGNATVGGTLSVTGDVDVADKIVHTGDTNTDIRFPAADTFTVTTAGTEALRVDSSQKLLIGTTSSQGHASGNLLEIGNYTLTNAGVTINNPTNGAGLILFGDSSSTNRRGRIEYNHTADAFRFYTADSERVRIDSSGNFGVGTDSPNAGLNVGLGGNTVPSAGASTGSALFGNATGGNAYGLVLGATSGGVGYISAQRADGTATTYNLVLQPNGSGVGINNDSPDGKLAILHTLNSAYGTTSRNNSFLQIRNDSTTSGCYAGIEIAAQGAGNDSITQLTTVDTGSGNTDFVIGLRSSSTFTEKARFQNSGGVSFNGDTATANALDDYEEGTWTPVVSQGTVAVYGANYTKIGNKVHLTARLNTFSNRTSGDRITITGLPYSTTKNAAAGTMFARYANKEAFCVYVNSSSEISFYQITNSDFVTLDHDNLTNASAQIYLNATYFV